MQMPTDTQITVRVIANDGKFLGDDIGGAAITIRDAETREVLAQRVTCGDSGPNYNKNTQVDGLMCIQQARGTPILMNPDDPMKTCNFTTTLSLSSPRRVEVTAFGPLAARASANTVSVTTWIYPGMPMTAGNGLLLELHGLICQIVSPPAHSVYQAPANVKVIANVAMMCGCPISDDKADNSICGCVGKDQPWPTSDFQVFAVCPGISSSSFPMTWDSSTGTAGRFTCDLPQASDQMSYQITVYAQQKSTGNTGVDFTTFLIPKTT